MALTAIPVGFFAGLLGIGGGLITVPVLYYIFGNFGFDNSFIMHLAVGTSFSIIIPTSIASTLTHMKYRAVNLEIVKSYGIFVAFGVLIGTIFLTVCLVRLTLNHCTREHHFGFEAAAWYWHFVDVVWLFLFVTVYWWGS